MKNVKIILLLLFIIIGSLVSCDTEPKDNTESNDQIEAELLEHNIGKYCTVQLRRDMLGQSADLPTPPQTDTINGADVKVSGQFVSMVDEWIIIENKGKEIWIYKPNILLIEFEE